VSAATLAVLLLADGRLPSGGHAHSGGMEAAIVDGRVGDLASLEAFLVGRLVTTGLMEASMAAATAWSLAGTSEPNDLIPELAAGITMAATADLAVHHALTTPAQAAVRLLGLDPFAVAALTADLAPLAAGVAAQAVELATGPLHDLPGPTGPVLEIAAVEHALRDGRMFAT
jgi:urease accessory protein